MAADFAFVSPSLSRHGLGNLFHLSHCHTVPASKRFESKVEAVPMGDGSLVHCGLLQVDDSDVQGTVLTSSPIGKVDICRPTVVAREKELPL